ncbi:MAG TPA: VanZ family protein [Opitutaceae bacterium]|nr:VanZ family protein [Opitutaceae bacterium]
MSGEQAPTHLSVWRALWPVTIAVMILSASQRSQVAAPGISNIDKVAHFAVFGLLGTLVCRFGKGRRGAAWALAIVSAFGASDEWHQSFVPGRSSDVMDWIADTSGAALAIALYAGWPAYRRLLETPIGRRRPRPGQRPGLQP